MAKQILKLLSKWKNTCVTNSRFAELHLPCVPKFIKYLKRKMELLRKSSKREAARILELYEYMIVTKSWWDTVDFIASNLLGVYFSRFPEEIERTTQRWMKSRNMWLQRSCLLFQLKYKNQTNTVLLDSLIVQLNGSSEFFIKKAIGWILREYSKTNPDFVKNYVATNNLSALSSREALLWMKKKESVLLGKS